MTSATAGAAVAKSTSGKAGVVYQYQQQACCKDRHDRTSRHEPAAAAQRRHGGNRGDRADGVAHGTPRSAGLPCPCRSDTTWFALVPGNCSCVPSGHNTLMRSTTSQGPRPNEPPWVAAAQVAVRRMDQPNPLPRTCLDADPAPRASRSFAASCGARTWQRGADDKPVPFARRDVAKHVVRSPIALTTRSSLPSPSRSRRRDRDRR